MTTTPGFLSGSIGTKQDLFTITFPLADIQGTLISNVSKATTAVVTTATTLPTTFLDGDLVLVAGVQGMTQLATAGVDSGRTFYANVISSNTFGLYTTANLSANVNSSSFSNATASTGTVSFFTVPQYNSETSPQTVAFDTEDSSAGTDIALDAETGVLTLATDLSYSLTAVVNCNRTVPATSTAGVQWFNITADEAIGPFVKFGEACVTTFIATEESEVALKIYSDADTFEYPNQVTGSFTAEVIGGYTVV